MACRTKANYYTNPAFSQQSEFLNGKRALSPQRSIRQSPVGAQAPLQIVDDSPEEYKHDSDEYEEQQFYEEIFVDDDGIIKDKKFVIIAQNKGKRYIQVPQTEPVDESYDNAQELNDHKYEEVKNKGDRYEYIPMREQDKKIQTPRKRQENARSPVSNHHYNVVDEDEIEETELSIKNARYVVVPVEELENLKSASRSRYEYMQGSPSKARPNENYMKQNQNGANVSYSRQSYQVISQNQTRCIAEKNQSPRRQETVQMSIQQQRAAIATQKLHEFLSSPMENSRVSTPVHSPAPSLVLSPRSQRRLVSSPIQQVSRDPFIVSTPPKRNSRQYTPKAHKKLNYAIGSQQVGQEKRNTAIIAPMCSSPIQSIYSETTFSSKSASWLNLNSSRKPAQRILFISAALLILCGSVNCGLGFYMTSIMGKYCYLDFGIISGFVAIALGLSGLRSRGCCILPGGNLSGYILLSLFSLSTCVSLLILLFTRPKAGSPLAEIMSTVVIGISILSFIVAAYGIVSSFCVKSPPRDNRVQHSPPVFHV